MKGSEIHKLKEMRRGDPSRSTLGPDGIELRKYHWWQGNTTKPRICGASAAYFMN